ncbi:NusG domain II-containing protein [Natranaerobius trueperi]|uniref:Uncharacterized protein n=1 Tax=Natranaerobius trueperi TaxID=759412 RepID=A0A226BWT1_9FIRM|nr:NusG domain II-containing protein [Natranaerobius trueperi]OWZ83498.1 hypothetical protein CDO51_08370 [Natranaerobius trueperi]
MSLKKYLKVITVGDIIITGVLLIAIALSIFFFWGGNLGQEDEGVAVIELDGEIVKEIDMPSEGETKKVAVSLIDEDYNAVVELEHNRVRLKRMPSEICPLHICSDTGWISQERQAIVCIPNDLMIYLEGGEPEDNDLDGITG